MSLIIDYPWYSVLLCLLLGVAYSVVLYWLGRRGAVAALGRRTTLLLSLLRTAAVAAIAFLFLSPLVRREASRKEKPIVIIAEDNSRSLDFCPDSAFYHGDFQRHLSNAADALSDDFEVVRYRYGGTLHDAGNDSSLFADVSTDMASMLSEIAERYYHRNVGAVVVTGDGIYNAGANPVGVAASLPFPVYTVAMGDTAVHRDASVANVRFNRIAYLGNSFPMEVTVNASRLSGEHATLSVSCDGKTLYSKTIHINDNHFSTTESLLLDADRAGMHNYVVEISPLRDEQSLRNNRRVVPVEVIDGHQKVAVIAAAPHPDVAALARAIGQNQNYEVETFLAAEFNKKVQEYSLLVLHQLPSRAAGAGLDIAALLRSDVPAIFVLGSQTDLPRLNALHAGLEVFTRIERQNEVTPIFNRDFTFFTLPDETAARIERFPPLSAPFGEYRSNGGAQTLFSARVGSVNSGSPMVLLTQQGGTRHTFVVGEGLWRWRLADYQANQTHADFDALIDKLVTFTALRVNKEKFRIEAKSVFGGTETVLLEAQLYNDNFEPVNTPDVDLTLNAKEGTDGPHGSKYSFNRSGTGYSLNLGVLPPGSYSYSATTRFNGIEHSASGSFLVEELQLEAINLVADHSLLATLAATTGGAMVDARHVDALPDLLRRRDDIKTVLYNETRYSDMLNMPLIFILIVLLLGVEWVIRKYNGEV